VDNDYSYVLCDNNSTFGGKRRKVSPSLRTIRVKDRVLLFRPCSDRFHTSRLGIRDNKFEC